MRIRRIGMVLVAVVAVLSFNSIVMAGNGPPHGTIYAHDVAYRTVGTPTNLPNHGKFDTIYVLGEPLANVSESAPGDMDFNGGRWEVRPITWLTIAPTQFTNAEQITQAAQMGQISIGEVVKRFECPLIKKH